MKKTIFFAGVMGVILMGAAHAFPTDPTSYPTFTGNENTAGTDYAVHESGIKVATKKYVGARVTEVSSEVTSLSNSATTQQATVTANGSDITAMQSNRQVTTTNADELCANLASHTEYSGCGYVSNNGTGSNQASDYKWVLIASETATAGN